MSEDESKANGPAQPESEVGVLVGLPIITRVENNTSPYPTVVGTANARHNVAVFDAHTLVRLSAPSRANDWGGFTLTVNQALPPGENCMIVQAWDEGDWYLSSRIWGVNTSPSTSDEEAFSSIELDQPPLVAPEGEGHPGNTTWGYTRPFFSSVVQGMKIPQYQVFMVGGGHARSWVYLENAVTGELLSIHRETDYSGYIQLTINKLLSPGVHDLVVRLEGHGDWHMYSAAVRIVILPQPSITTSLIPSLPGILTVTDGVYGASMELWEAYGAEALQTSPVWGEFSQFSIQSLPKSPIDLVCRQYFPQRKYLSNTYSEFSLTRTVTVQTLSAPEMVNPWPDYSFSNTTIHITGRKAVPFQRVVIKNESEDVVYGESSLSTALGDWAGVMNLSGYFGSITIKARHSSHPNAAWTKARTIHLPLTPPPPEITGPAPSSTQNAEFTLTGTDGVAGATLRVFVSQKEIKVGEIGPLSGSNWSCPVATVPPGATSLVAIQTISGVDSARSVARTFKVRPSMLSNITPTFTTENEVNFAGTGVEGATIVFTWVSGEVTAPASVVVEDGKWKTTATNWPFGKYSAVVIQKVSDNDGGWIESYGLHFDVQVPLPVPSDVTYTKVYRPTISGKGTNGATVLIRNPGGSLAAPDVLVSDGKWSGQVIEGWWGGGPMYQKEIHIQQTMGGHNPSGWFVLKVTIPPLAPVIEKIEEGVLSPTFTGTCWSQGATVLLTFSDTGATQYPATVTGSNWSFERATLFAEDVPLRVAVTQNVAQQTSLPVSQNFIVSLPIPQPEITDPPSGSQVGRDLTVHGKKGMTGFTMQLRDAQSGADLGSPKTLDSDDVWFIGPLKLAFRPYNIVAVQKRNQRESVASERVDVTVVLLPPVITLPSQNGQLPRKGMLEGKGMPGGHVTIWLEGATEPLVSKVPVDNDSNWKVEVTLLVGFKNIQAGQTFEDQTSLKSEMLSFSVVPAAPIIETPVVGAHIGRRTVVSGFGVSGDTVTVALTQPTRTVLGSSVVLEDRTWSMTLEFALPGGDYALVAVASSDGFDSADSQERPVVLGTYLPAFESPAAGQWTSDPVGFNGQGRAGVGEVQSWFSSERIWAPDLPVTTAWQGRATQPLPHGGNWCRFKQTITDDADGATVSDYVESKRFEVLPPPTKS